MAVLVREVMTPGIVAVRPDAPVVEAARLMRAQDVGEVLVAEGGQLIGVLTDRDITLRAVADGADPLTVSAQAVCTHRPVAVAPGDAVPDAVRLMRERAVRRLPVVENGRAVGMVGLGDLAVAQDPDSAPAGTGRAGPDTRPDPPPAPQEDGAPAGGRGRIPVNTHRKEQ